VPVLKARVGGAWVDVGGAGVSEVAIGPADPGDSTTELWYDTDEPNLYDPDTSRWNCAWGQVASASVVNAQNGIGAATDLTGLSVTFTAVAGRNYVATTQCCLYINGAGTTDLILSDGSNNSINGQNAAMFAAGFVPFPEVVSHAFSPPAGPYTVKTKLSAASTTVNTAPSPARPGYIKVEDVGPVSLSSNPPAQPASVWTNLTLLNNWVNFDPTLYPAASYRMVGDMVQLRGLIKSGTIGQNITNLPVGFRAQRIVHLPVASENAFGMVRISVNGDMNAVVGTNGWFDLANIQYSVTA
jgi:hypothetical protein